MRGSNAVQRGLSPRTAIVAGLIQNRVLPKASRLYSEEPTRVIVSFAKERLNEVRAICAALRTFEWVKRSSRLERPPTHGNGCGSRLECPARRRRCDLDRRGYLSMG